MNTETIETQPFDRVYRERSRTAQGEPGEPQAPRPWVTPAFECVPLKEALSGSNFTTNDGSYPGS